MNQTASTSRCATENCEAASLNMIYVLDAACDKPLKYNYALVDLPLQLLLSGSARVILELMRMNMIYYIKTLNAMRV